MKKYLLAVILFAISLSASSQVFYNGEKLYSSRITGKKLGNLLGAYVTVGISSAKQNLMIEGKTSENIVNEQRPVFKFKFGASKDSIFMDRANMDKIILVKIYPKKNARQLRIGKYGLAAGVQTSVGADDMIPLNIEEDEENDNTFIVRPKGDLEDGEYCFYYTDKQLKHMANKVYDFNIKCGKKKR